MPRLQSKKGKSRPQGVFKKKPELLKSLLNRAKASLKDAAAVNATRFAVGNSIKELGIPTTFWSGGRTKKNRLTQGYPKEHWIDAACVGETGEKITIPTKLVAKTIKATGHGDRQLCLVDKHGFPRSQASAERIVFGFKTGDMVTASVSKGTKAGVYRGRVAVRSNGNFNISTSKGVIQGISYRFCRKLHSADGYSY